MSAGSPWSVKGIDAEARSVAKELARRAGMTLGEWLNQMILEGRDIGAELARAVPQARPASRAQDVRRPIPANSRGAPDPRRLRAEANDRQRQAAYEPGIYDDDYAHHDQAESWGVTPVYDDGHRPQPSLQARDRGRAEAVRDVSRAVEALLGRLERSEGGEGRRPPPQASAPYPGEYRNGDDGYLRDYEAMERAPHRASDPATIDRVAVMHGQLDAQGARLTQVETTLEAGIGRLSTQIQDESQRQRGHVAEVRADVVGLSHRLGQLEARDPQRDVHALIDQAVARMGQRLDGAEARTQAAIKVLEQAFASLDSRVLRAEERGDVTDPDTVVSLSRLNDDLSRRVDEVRQDMRQMLTEALGGLAQEAALAALETRLGEAEIATRKAASEAEDRAVQLNACLDRIETGIKEEFGTELSALKIRIESGAAHEQALERLGGEIARLSERLGLRISEHERRTAQVLSGVSEQIEAGHNRFQSELTNRISQSESRTQKILEEAQARLEQRLVQTRLLSHQAAGPAQATPSSLPRPDHSDPATDESDTLSRDLPNPFASHKSLAENLSRPVTRSPDLRPERTTALQSLRRPTDVFRDIPPVIYPAEARRTEDALSAVPELPLRSLGDLDIETKEAAGLDPTPLSASDDLTFEIPEARFEQDRVAETVAAVDLPPVFDEHDDLDPFRGIDSTRRAGPDRLEARRTAPLVEPDPVPDPVQVEADDLWAVDEARPQAFTESHENVVHPHEMEALPHDLTRRDQGASMDVPDDLIGDEDHELFTPIHPSTAASRRAVQDALERARAAVLASQKNAEDRPVAPVQGAAKLDFGTNDGRKGGFGTAVKASSIAVLATVIGVGGYISLKDMTDPGARTLNGSSRKASHSQTLQVETESPDRAAVLNEVGSATSGSLAPAIDQTEMAETAYKAAQRALTANDPNAVILLKKLADQGYGPAQNTLARIYDGRMSGFGLVDKAQARAWYERAASSGLDEARYNLAMMYYSGEGGPVDKAGAANLFRAAAVNGMGNAQYNLATLYINGDGVPVDFTEAYRWYRAAALKGDNEAAGRARELRPKLSEKQISLAESEAVASGTSAQSGLGEASSAGRALSNRTKAN